MQNRDKRELQGHKGSQKGVGYNIVLGQEVTPQSQLCLCIRMDHIYIYIYIYIYMERETLGFHLPLSLHLIILLIFYLQHLHGFT